MKSLSAIYCAALAITSALLFSPAVYSEVNVTFKEPKKFTDFEYSNSSNARSVERLQKDFEKLFTEASKNYLKPGHRLSVEITDLDKAGRIDYHVSNTHEDVRILRDVERVRVDLTFTLTDENQQVIASGEQSLKEFVRADGIASRSAKNKSLYYEQKVIENWLKTIYR